MDANSLVNLPTLGTFQISQIECLTRSVDSKEDVWQLVQTADPEKQETLQSTAEYDQMNAEQTWPDEQELKEGSLSKSVSFMVRSKLACLWWAHFVAELKTVKKKVPKGTSDYQAAWILDSEEEEEEEDEDSDNEDDDEDDEDEDEDEDEDDDEGDEEEKIDEDDASAQNNEEMESVKRLTSTHQDLNFLYCLSRTDF